MSDLAHALWGGTLALIGFAAHRVALSWLRLLLRRLELDDERKKQVEALAKRFDDVERMANQIKTEWFNTKAMRK